MKFTQQNVQCLSPSGLHRMAYTEWGDRQNPRVLVCVHGLTRNGRDFDALAEAIVERVWQVRARWLGVAGARALALG